jgi:uncharacterized protein YgiB involved in biofilm formation
MDKTRDNIRSPRRFSARTRPRLVLGGLAAAAGMSLSACDSTPDFNDAQFTSVAECVKAGFDAPVCEAGYNTAALEYQKSAPKFNTLKSCEQEWGSDHCAPANTPGTSASTGSVFMPMLAGFVISQALQRRYYEGGNISYYGGYGGYAGSPIYRNRTGGTVVVDRSGGAVRSMPVNVNTHTVSRSGFGGMSMSRGSSFGG